MVGGKTSTNRECGEMVDMLALGASAERRRGSSPLTRTSLNKKIFLTMPQTFFSGIPRWVQQQYRAVIQRIMIDSDNKQLAVKDWYQSNASRLRRVMFGMLLLTIPFLLSAQAPKQGFVQTYNGDNLSQVVLAISSNRLFMQSLAPGDPIMSFRILTHVQDQEENFLRVQAKDGELHTVICNRFNAVFTSQWGNTWYWNLGTENEPATDSTNVEPQTIPEDKPQLLDRGTLQNGVEVLIYPEYAELALKGKEPYVCQLLDEVITDDNGTRGFYNGNLIVFLPARPDHYGY